jgi:hypothetical protein
MTMQKTVLDGKYIDVISLASQGAADPQFKKLKDASIPQKKQDYMSFPIFTPGGDLYLTI